MSQAPPSSADVVSLQPELLAPAGDRTCVTAAVENGADAVYFGLECGFNARVRATNLHLDNVAEVMEFLHRRGVKGYVTLNTLVFPEELSALEGTIVRLTEAGVDALLIQDLGLARLVRAVSPDLPLHASTQMTLTSAECIEQAESLGLERVVLARELSLAEIKQIRRQTTVALEAFVHGALCVAYSGQCLTSESLGGRSANRGHCAQACRLPYEVVCDGQQVDLGPVQYLLSPQDLAAYDLVPELIAAGITALKIEGRLKKAEYVANITRHYRRAIDEAVAGHKATFSPQEVTEMELSFSRGFASGWLEGNNHKRLVPGLSSAKRGVLLGEVHAVRGQKVLIVPRREVAPGDGVVFAADRLRDAEQGGRVYEVRPQGDLLELGFANHALDLTRLTPGQQVWKTDDPQLTARLRATYSGTRPRRRVDLDLEIAAAVGQVLRITGRAANGGTCEVCSAQPLAAAVKHPLREAVLRAQLGRLGGTVYRLRKLASSITGTPMVPLSVLGELRRAMILGLEATAGARPCRRINSGGAHQLLSTIESQRADGPHGWELRVLCRTLDQLATVLGQGVTSVAVDFADIRQYSQAVELARQFAARILLATPRIQKPGEQGLFVALAKQEADGLLVRNLAGIGFCRAQRIPFVADFSLNAANQLTVDWLRTLGAEQVTVSYDLNREQLLSLVDATPPAWLEVVVHQHMPMFHMEHCVFCAVLSPGTDKTNCGRPCDEHTVYLRDRVDKQHLLQADVGCRNTLFNAVPQSAAEAVTELLRRGLRCFRLELLAEQDPEIVAILRLYRALLSGQTSGRKVWQELQAANRVGVTRGTLEERRDPLAIL